MSHPIVASYCTTFLKPEMLHIYRQIAGLERYRTFVIAKERICEDRYPFGDIEIIPCRRSNFIVRFYLKYLRRLPPIYYRGEYRHLVQIVERRRPNLMHIYFGHTGVHLNEFIAHWRHP